MYGIWAVATEQGKIAGANAVGDNLEYLEKQQPINFIGMNTEVFSIGNIDVENIEGIQENKFYDYKNGFIMSRTIEKFT